MKSRELHELLDIAIENREKIERYWNDLDEDISVPALLMGIGDRARTAA